MSTVKSRPQARPIDILVADDDPDCRTLVRDALLTAQLPCRLAEASDGHEALEFLQRRGRCRQAKLPELVVLDIEMPGLSGLKVLQRMRADRQLREIPVFIVSSSADRRIEASENGASAFFTKPVDPGAFTQAVLRVLAGAERRRHSRNEPSGTTSGGRIT